MSQPSVPFNRPCYLGNELDFVGRAIASGKLSGGGEFNKECERALSAMLGSPALMVTSCTHALEMSALLLDLREGDEVIVPTFTFVSTANAFALRGASICFVDNDEHGNIDVSAVEKAITPKTKAVVVVHYGGNSCDMERLKSICDQHRIHLVEDAAQSIGVTFRGKPLGTFGTFGCFSFHDTKNITAGEGGALVVNDPAFMDRAEIIREKGTNRKMFLQGSVDKYTWVGSGSSYVLSELNAAHLLPQLQAVDQVNAVRNRLWQRYAAELEGPLEGIGCRILKNPSENRSNGHIFAVFARDLSQRNHLIQFLRERSVSAYFHYISLHSAPGARLTPTRMHEEQGSRRLHEVFTDRLVRLPLFYNLTEAQLAHTIQSMHEWRRTQA